MHYKAMDERGRMATGRLEAMNVADLELRLERMGLDLINCRVARTGLSRPGSARVKRRDLISFCFQLEQLVSAGVPVLDSLTDLRDSVDNRQLREVIASMVESIEGGKTLSGAMADHPQVFDDVFINLVSAGEVSGQVSRVLRQITETLKWQDEQAAIAKRLITYPAATALVVLVVLAFLMTYVVPQLVTFIAKMEGELPLHTRALLAVSDIFVNFWYVILLLPVIVFIGVLWLAKVSSKFQLRLDGWKLRIWIIGPILRKIILARFANYFAMMYASGITVLECVRISESLAGNKVIEEATRRAGRQIAEGATISGGFESTGLFPPLVIRMLRVGESTGALDTALLNISYFYNRDVEESMANLQTLIVPVLTALLGALLLWVAISVLGPIYDLISKIEI